MISNFFNWLFETKGYHLASYYTGMSADFSKWMAGTNLVIFLVHLCIAIMLFWFVFGRKDLYRTRRDRWVGILFALFLLFGGTTHLLRSITSVYPIYNLLLAMNIIVMCVSWTLIAMMFPLLFNRPGEANHSEISSLSSQVQEMREDLARREARLDSLIAALKSLPRIRQEDTK